jgi:hypothetical protein
MRGKRASIMMLCLGLSAAAAVFLGGEPVRAADWFAAAGGRADAKGTRQAPWDLASALAGRQKIGPGDTLWVHGGTYRHPDRGRGSPGYVVHLAGQEQKPIRVLAEPGQRVTIDGGLSVEAPAGWLEIRDLEILVSENLSKSRVFPDPGSSPKSYDRPWGGLNVYSGQGCRYVNLVIHDNAQGISFWSGATQSEVHGCILYDNGWKAPDRGHGHAIYTQNQNGLKTIENCIMTGGYGYSLHAYGSARAYVDNYLLRHNVCYDAGRFLVGGGRPSHNIRAIENWLYNVGMQIGYVAPYNEDCEVAGNVIVGGDLEIVRYRNAVNRDNRVIARGAPRPPGPPQVVIQPYRLDPQRANVVIFNWGKETGVRVDPAAVLHAGDRFRLMNPRDFYGAPVLAGSYAGRPLVLPVAGEFAAYVLLKEPGASASRARGVSPWDGSNTTP